MEKLLEVGDKIKVSPGFNFTYIVNIEKVTKSKAVGYTASRIKFEFKRAYTDNLLIRPFKREKWDTTDRKLVYKSQNL